jgi:hypothetical protein
MPQTITNCPRCKTRVPVEFQQVFDMNVDPQAKDRFLSRNYNLIACPTCGYQGNMATPLVYHDPEKELLLTYFPAELGLPVNEQEKILGPIITGVVNALPNDKKKGYLFRPQAMFTLDTMYEKVLEADGITKEMIQEQQKKLNLLQKLMSVTDEGRIELIKQEEANIDESFFAIMSQLAQATVAQGDKKSAEMLLAVQNDLLEHTELGRKLKKSASETQAAMNDLKALSEKGLTREDLIQLLLNAPSELYLQTAVSMARPALDYIFFQTLTERLDQSDGEEKRALIDLRDKLIKLTQEIDKAVQEHTQNTLALMDELMNAPDTAKTLEEHLDQIDDFFVQLVQSELQQARKKSDLERVGKIEKVIIALQKYTAPPPEIEFIEQLISAEKDEDRDALLEKNADQVTPEFLQIFDQLVHQSESQHQSAQMVELLKKTYKQVLRFSMKKNLTA